MYAMTLTEAFFPAQPADDGGPAPAPVTIGEMLHQSAQRAPDHPALKELLLTGEIGRVWTYQALLDDSIRLANALASRHPAGTRIAVFANNCPEWVLLELAASMAQLVLVTVNPAYQKAELKFVLEQSRSEAIYYVNDFRGNPIKSIADEVCADLPAITHRILLTDHKALFAGEDEPHDRTPKPDDPVQIQYTSGTTGFPKGALLHHNGLVRNGIDCLHRSGITPDSVYVHYMPLFHTTGCAILVLGGLGAGATMILAPLFDPALIAKTFERENVTMFFGVPTMIVALLEEIKRQGYRLPHLKRISSGGAMVAPELCREARAVLGAPIQIVYGQTESSPVITHVWAEDSLEDMTETIGQPMPHVDVSIRRPDDNTVCALNEQGEICCRGYLVMKGYNDNPEATAAAIDEDGWLHTGDLGTMDARGYLKITGRVKEMIIRGGENLFPVEIENAMLEHPDVAEVAVVGIPDKKWGEQVACFMRPVGETRPTDADLKTFIRRTLSPQKTPAFWVWLDEWPLTGSGKIQKFKLREAFVAGAFSQDTKC
ncbi:MAG: AMP-binding protein [Pseudomonadota bacterium]